MKLLWLIVLLFIPTAVFGADFYLGEVQGGQALPEPYQCLSYQGRGSGTSTAMGLAANECAGKTNNWIVVPKMAANTVYPKGYYATEFDTVVLIFESVTFNNVKVYWRVK